VGVFKRGASPSFQNLPPLLDKERGTQVRRLKDSSRGEVTILKIKTLIYFVLNPTLKEYSKNQPCVIIILTLS